ncbi:peptidase C14, partial [Prosthecomicrobium hirschii]|uniref:caspase family protein n=1 Tax=Prosthecodimorpha hirschii TaxID=665126 RepID=UPI001125E854
MIRVLAVFATLVGVALFQVGGAGLGHAQNQAELRFGLVIGNDSYAEGPLATAANDAGLVADTLGEAGFDVTGLRNQDQTGMRRAMRDFLDKVGQGGGSAVAFVYVSGYGLQYEGENYLVPAGARIDRDTDIPIEAIRVSDFTRALAALPIKARMVVLDASRPSPFARNGQPLAAGLALTEPEPGTLLAFNAAPGSVEPPANGDYGPYAQALAEVIRLGGLEPDQVFARVRLRVDQLTGGATVPWHASNIEEPFQFFEGGAPDQGQGQGQGFSQGQGQGQGQGFGQQQGFAQAGQIPPRPASMREAGPAGAYAMALERDDLDAFEEFLSYYGNDPLAGRVRALMAARREAITWRRTVEYDSAEAYWSYLRRYPNGPHAADARRRLGRLSAAYEPPSRFQEVEYDVAPPPEPEVVYVGRPNFGFTGYAPPPPPPTYLLPPTIYVLPPKPVKPPPSVILLPQFIKPQKPFILKLPANVVQPPVQGWQLGKIPGTAPKPNIKFNQNPNGTFVFKQGGQGFGPGKPVPGFGQGQGFQGQGFQGQGGQGFGQGGLPQGGGQFGGKGKPGGPGFGNQQGQGFGQGQGGQGQGFQGQGFQGQGGQGAGQGGLPQGGGQFGGKGKPGGPGFGNQQGQGFGQGQGGQGQGFQGQGFQGQGGQGAGQGGLPQGGGQFGG